MDVSKINLRQVILHTVPRAGFRDKDTVDPTLSDLPADLDAQRTVFLEEKIRATLRYKARPVVEEAATPAANAIRGFLQAAPEKRDLVATSKELARLLYIAQPGIANAGVVLVAELEFAGSVALLLAKLDRETGMRAFTVNEEGQLRVDIDFLTDLFVTDGTKVFKIGVFAADDLPNGALVGNVVDEQSRGLNVAHYFMSVFLGCAYAQRPQELTENFMRGVEDFINSSRVPDAETKARYSLALLTTLQSQVESLSAGKFAVDHLDPADRDAFVSVMAEHGVTGTAFPKDTSLVQSRLKRVQIETTHDVFIMAPPDRLDDGTVKIKPADGGQSVVEVIDEVRSVKSRG